MRIIIRKAMIDQLSIVLHTNPFLGDSILPEINRLNTNCRTKQESLPEPVLEPSRDVF